MPRANTVEFLLVGRDLTGKAFGTAAGAISKAAAAAAKATKLMAAASVAAGGALLAMSHRAADAQDRVQKLSDRLGIGVTQLSQFHHHAELSGLRTRTFDMALQRMSRRVAEAAQETGEAQGAIKELGLDAKALAGLPLDRQMLAVADAIQSVEDPATKTRLAFKLFDSEGVAMLQTMKDGSEGFRQSARDLDRLGQTMDAQGTANAAKFKDEWLRLQKAVGGVSKGIADEFIPIFAGVFDRVSDAIAENRQGIVNFVTGAVRGFLTFGMVLQQVLRDAAGFIGKLFNYETAFDALDQIATAVKNTFTNIVGFAQQAGPAVLAALVASFKAAFKIAVEIARTAWFNIFDIFSGKDLGDTIGAAVKRGMMQAKDEMETVKVAFTDLATTVEGAAGRVSEGATEMLGVNMEAIRAQADAAIQNLIVMGEVAEEERNKNLTGVQDNTARIREMYDQFTMTQMEITESYAANLKAVMDNAVSGIGDGIADIIVDGKSAVEVFKNIAKTVLKSLISTYIQMKIQRLLFAKTDAAASIGLTGANTMASMSLAPFPINLTAPAVAASHASVAAGFASTALAGALHGGMDFVPAETSFLLQKGERVISPRQNEDLTEFLARQDTASGGNYTVNVFTSAQNFDGISESDVREFVAGKIIPAMDRLDRQGIRPAAIERAIT